MHQAPVEISEHQRESSPVEVVLSGEPSRFAMRWPQKKNIDYILILGPSGSGKSSLINAVSNEQMAVASPGSGLCTTSFRNAKVTIGERLFRIIDSPGFNITSMTSHEIVKQLVLYLMNLYHSRDIRLTGVLYLHPADSDLGSDENKQNLAALKILLGEFWLPSVTIAVVPGPSGKEPDDKVIHSIQEHTSPFYEFFHGGAKICNLSPRVHPIQQILLGYKLQPPRMPHFHTQFKNGRPHGLEAYIEEHLGLPKGVKSSSKSQRPRRLHRPEQSQQLEQAEQPDRPELFQQLQQPEQTEEPQQFQQTQQPQQTRQRQQHQQPRSAGRGQRRSLVSALDQSTGRLQQLELALTEVGKERDSLNDQLEQTRSEYASLRSELQLRDNMEQHMIVQSLKDLNRRIDNFGRLTAEYLVDNHIDAHSTNVTTLQATSLSELKDQFGHSEGIPSLVASSTGQGVPIEDFMDFALRSILCRRLSENIFLPFHPSLANSSNDDFMAKLYAEVRAQEHPTVAAKWRASSFSAISKRGGSEIRARAIDQYVEQIIRRDVDRLFKGFFGHEAGVALPKQQHDLLHEIVTSAWDWNHVLKGTVIFLGDFQPVTYGTGSTFDHLRMEEFEGDERGKLSPEIAISTLGLGLILSRSKVKGSVPDEEVVCRAIVVTEQRYN